MIQAQQKEILQHSIREVFDVGIRPECWPTMPAVEYADMPEVLSLHETFGARLAIPGVGFLLRSAMLENTVTEFNPYRSIEIIGKSKLGETCIAFALAPKKESTVVTYSFSAELSKGGRIVEPVIKQFVTSHVPEFATGFKANVNKYLDAAEQAPPLRKAS